MHLPTVKLSHMWQRRLGQGLAFGMIVTSLLWVGWRSAQAVANTWTANAKLGAAQQRINAMTAITPNFLLAWGSYGAGNGQFSAPFGTAVDGSGAVYVTDYYNHRVQKFSATGSFITAWGSYGTSAGQFVNPAGIVTDSAGNVYVSDISCRIQKFTSSGSFILQWGSCGTSTGQFRDPGSVALDSSGNVYVADRTNDRIQKFTSTGTFITAWGSNGTGNGQFQFTSGVAVDGSGNVYVVDNGNHRIQKFTSAGSFIMTWGSYGTGNGQLINPYNVAVDSTGNVYVADHNNHRIQKFSPTGVFITSWGSYGSGNGQFSSPASLAVDSAGNAYVADVDNNRIQKFGCNVSVSVNFVTTWGSNGSGTGQFNYPWGLTVDGSGNVYVADSDNNRIQKFSSTGSFVTAWGSFGTGNGQFRYPKGVAVDSTGNLFIADTDNHRIQKLSSTGSFLTTWGSFGSGTGQFNYPWGLTVDGSGNVYVADSDNSRIQKFSSTGSFVTAWGSFGTGNGQFRYPKGVAVDSAGNLFIADTDNQRIQKLSSAGSFLTAWGSFGNGTGQFNYPWGLTVDGGGNVYVADTDNNRIQKFSSASSFITLWGGFGTGNGQFRYPKGVAVDGSGNVFITDTDNHRIQKFSQTYPVLVPVANAGPDQAIVSTGALTAVTLNGTGSVSNDPNHPILAYEWSEGTTSLGSGATLNTSLSLGTHTITLAVTNECLQSSLDTVTINIYAPVAAFTATPNPAACGQNISFDGSASYDTDPARTLTSYAWNFGDGATATGPGAMVNHTYAAFGNYTATLTVTDDTGAQNTASHTINVNQGNVAPVAQTGGPYVVIIGSGVAFNGSGSSDANTGCGDSIVSYAWNIAGGAYTLPGAQPSLSAAQVSALGAGSHSVALTVADTFGATGTASTTLTISPPAPTLGDYGNTTVAASGNTTITPTAVPANTSSINVATSTSFKGTLAANPATGVVMVTDAHPAGSYTVTVTAFGAGGTTTKTFTLMINNPVTCASGNAGFKQAAGSPVSVGDRPASVAISDFNGDGRQDLATVNFGSSNATILLGNGSGAFTPAAGSPVSVGSNPLSVTAGDFNGDGKQDLAAANFASNNVTILLGDGAGGFAQAAGSPVSVGVSPRSIAVGDFNNDGKHDLVTANSVSGDLTILLGNGGGGFTPAAGSPVSVGGSTWAVAVGDFNGDGQPDLAAANTASGNVAILLGNGSGGFTPAAGSPVSTGFSPQFVSIGDINGDGQQDLAVANYASDNVTILLGNGSGGFAAAASSPVSVGLRPRSVTLGDFNGDGKQDLATANELSNNTTVLLGNGSGGFTPVSNSPLSVGSGPYFVTVGDFDANGKQDLVVANPNSSNVTILLNNCAPTIAAGTVARQQGSPAGTAVTIAAVSDGEDAAGSLSVAVIAGGTATGITLGSITNTSGTISATVAASCTATAGTVRLQVTDSGGLTATSDLQVNVTANDPPTVGTYADQTVVPGGGVTVTPSVAPADNGSIASVGAMASAGFTGSIGAGNTTTGAVTITNAGPAGMYTVTVTVTDNCGATVQQAFMLTVNTAPTINAVANTRQQGGAASNSNIANVGDADGGALTVTINGSASAAVNGVTVSNIVNSGGTVTADILADCTATNASFTLTVTDNKGATNTATLNVTVTANTPSVLSYGNQMVAATGALTINPASGPSDNGSVSSIVVQSQGAYAGAISVDNVTGVVSLSNATPPGAHTLTMRATDNCGAQTNASFTVTVACINNPVVANNNDSGAGSLRQAIADACAGSTITFAGGVTGTILLTSGELNINKNLTIQGPGSGLLSISGNNASRVFAVATATVATLDGLTVTGGNGVGAADTGSGGAIVNRGTLTVSNSTVSNSTAASGGGLYNYSTLTLNNCTVSGNTAINTGGGLVSVNTVTVSNSTLTGNQNLNFVGAGMYVSGMATVTNTTFSNNQTGSGGHGGGVYVDTGGTAQFSDCTFTGNQAGFGAGLANTGTATLTNSKVANNTVTGSGGGLFNTNMLTVTNSTLTSNQTGNFVGAGLYTSATAILTNTTISNNQAGGGVLRGGGIFIDTGGAVTLTYCTLTGNAASEGGGIYNLSTLSAKNSIIAKNTMTVAAPDVFGPLTSQGFNLIGNSSGATIAAQASDQIGTAALPLDPLLGPLANNGGPTQTHAPLQGSPAIDQGGAASGITTDQRGQPRVFDFYFIPNAASGNGSDIGAVEVQSLPNTPPTFTAVNAQTPQQGSPASNAAIATVSDVETAAGSLTVAVASANPSGGVTVSNLVNTGGTITADVVAGCTATNATFTLQVSDGSLQTTATLNVSIAANSPPTLTYANQVAVAGGTLNVAPTTATDNGGIASFALQNQGGYTGTISVNPMTGAVALSNIRPTGGSTLTIRATDNCGATTDASFTLNVSCAPINVSAPAVNTSTAGAAFSQTFTQTGGIGATTFATASVLPSGLTLSTSGVLSGTPTQTGTFPISVTATDSNGCTGTVGYTLTVNCQTITVGPASIASGNPGFAYNQQFTQTGGIGTPSFSTQSALPSGLTLSANGLLAGTTAQTGSFPLTIIVTDGNGCQGTAGYTLSIGCPVITVTPPAVNTGTAGTAFSQTFTQTGGASGTMFSTSSTLPNGLTLSATGVLSGTPTQTGVFTLLVFANGSGGCNGSVSYTLTINCPSITVTPPTVTDGTASVAFNQSFTQTGALGVATFSLVSGALPPGLTLAVNGGLSGTPTLAGTFSFAVKVTDANNCMGTSANYTLVINCPAITLNPSSASAPTDLPGAQVGVAYNQTITAAPSGTAYGFAVTAGALPAGLSLNATSGVIGGTTNLVGTYTFTITATGWGNCTGSRQYRLTTACPAITLSTLANGTANTAYNQTLTATPSGGNYSFAVTTGSLPPGLTLAASGALTGTPTQAGTFNFTSTATGFGNCTGAQAYALVINCPTITLTASLPNGVQGTAYNQTIAASPAGTTFSYAVTANALPPGLSLSSTTGVLNGTPNVAGNYSFTITATGWGACSKSQSYNVLITGTCNTITVNPAALPAGTVGVAYPGQTLTATGGTAPYSFAVTGGTLPGGLSLTSAGVLSGTPTANGAFSFTIRATAQGGCTGSRSYVMTVSCGTLAFSPATLPNGVRGLPYSQGLSVTPAGSYTFSLLLGQLPLGYTLNSAGVISGVSNQTGSYNFTIKVMGGSCQGTKAYTLVIGANLAALAQQADYDGDGMRDPAVWLASTSVWNILRSRDQQTLQQTWGKEGDLPVLGDYDGDRLTDLAVFRPANGTWYIKHSGNGSFLTERWGVAADVPVPGDYDGDGLTDLAVFRPGDGRWYVRRSSDQQYAVTVWGAGYAPYNDVAAPGDYDGDGQTDLAVFRRLTGAWYIKRSSDNQVSVKQWGVATDVPVAADYDGDGQTDCAVWRQGTWYIWPSTAAERRGVVWGDGAAPYYDQPVPGDYDGDGQADLAVWRAATSEWFILCSADGAALLRQHGQSHEQPVPKAR